MTIGLTIGAFASLYVVPVIYTDVATVKKNCQADD